MHTNPTEQERRNLSDDIDTSRRELAEGKGIPHDVVMRYALDFIRRKFGESQPAVAI